MKNRVGRYSAAIGVAMVVLASGCAAPPSDVWNVPGLDKCQLAVEAEVSKLRKKVFDATKKCVDDYRKATLGLKPILTAATTCEAKLQKSVVVANTSSAIRKALDKLSAFHNLSPNKCTMQQLTALGHYVEPIGIAWPRLTLMAQLKNVYAQQTHLIGDFVNAFQALAATGGCPTCTSVATNPCVQRTCTLSANSEVSNYALGYSPTLSGTLALDVCDVSDLDGVHWGIFAANQAIANFDTTDGAAAQYACVRVISAEGAIGKTPSSTLGTINTCRDHIVSAPDSEECDALLGGAVCSSPQADPVHAGVMNGGICTRYLGGATPAGASSLLARIQVKLVGTGTSVLFPDQRGPDAMPCTSDDTAPAGNSFYLPLTTGSSTGTVLDTNNTDGMSTSVGSTGVAFDPAQVALGNLSGGRWVGTLPGLHAAGAANPASASDAVALLKLECQ